MRRAITIWDLLRVEDRAGLGRFIRWYDAEDDGTRKQFGAWMYDSHPDVPRWPPVPLRLEQYIEPAGDLFEPVDVLMPALIFLQQWVNHHLESHVSPRLLYHIQFLVVRHIHISPAMRAMLHGSALRGRKLDRLPTLVAVFFDHRGRRFGPGRDKSSDT
jgi:hypothetical protein